MQQCFSRYSVAAFVMQDNLVCEPRQSHGKSFLER